MEKLKRYIIFFIGLYINSLGVALITKASLGTSPISSKLKLFAHMFYIENNTIIYVTNGMKTKKEINRFADLIN